jgi:hypothetical protein
MIFASVELDRMNGMDGLSWTIRPGSAAQMIADQSLCHFSEEGGKSLVRHYP